MPAMKLDSMYSVFNLTLDKMLRTYPEQKKEVISKLENGLGLTYLLQNELDKLVVAENKNQEFQHFKVTMLELGMEKGWAHWSKYVEKEKSRFVNYAYFKQTSTSAFHNVGETARWEGRISAWNQLEEWLGEIVKQIIQREAVLAKIEMISVEAPVELMEGDEGFEMMAGKTGEGYYCTFCDHGWLKSEYREHLENEHLEALVKQNY